MFKKVEENMNMIRRELAINSTLRLNQQITWGMRITKFVHKESYPWISLYLLNTLNFKGGENLPTKKLLVKMPPLGKFYKTIKEKIVPILQKLSQKQKRRKHILNSLYKACIISITKPEKEIKRKLQTNISHEHRGKKFNKIALNQI